MGSLVGHVLPGLGFFLLGLWHLFNHIKLHILHPNTYTSSPWFPISKLRYFELIFIMMGSYTSVAFELFIGPSRHQPLDPDLTIPSNHLHNFEHATISMSFIVYAALAVFLDKIRAKAQYGLTLLLASIAFAIEYLLFHLHSSDHMGVEGQYHWLLQCLIAVCLATTVLGIALPNSFLVSFVRSGSILFQGIWFIVMGYMLWTPEFVPKGCFMHLDDGRYVVRCTSDEALHRAKALVNLEFSWYSIGVAALVVSFYLVLVKIYGEMVEYSSLTKDNNKQKEEEEEEDCDDETKLRIREKQNWSDEEFLTCEKIV